MSNTTSNGEIGVDSSTHTLYVIHVQLRWDTVPGTEIPSYSSVILDLKSTFSHSIGDFYLAVIYHTFYTRHITSLLKPNCEIVTDDLSLLLGFVNSNPIPFHSIPLPLTKPTT